MHSNISNIFDILNSNALEETVQLPSREEVGNSPVESLEVDAVVKCSLPDLE